MRTDITVSDSSKDILITADTAESERRITEALRQADGYHTQHLDWNLQSIDKLLQSKERKILIVWYEYLLRLKEMDPTLLFRLTRNMTVILALSKEKLLEASSVLGFADGCLFMDNYIDLTSDILKLGELGYTIVPPYIEPSFGTEKIRLNLIDKLTPTEKKVLVLLGKGETNRSIAEKLGITETHTKSIVRSILFKLQFRNRTEAGVFAARNKIEEAPE